MLKPQQVVRSIRQAARQAGLEVHERQGKGSHRFFRIGRCTTTVPFHRGTELGVGMLRKIEEDLAPCLGSRWLLRGKGR